MRAMFIIIDFYNDGAQFKSVCIEPMLGIVWKFKFKCKYYS